MVRENDRKERVEAVSDRFELLERIGSGAFGVVYRAFDEKRQAVVALKTLHQLQPRHLYHFKREFRSLADISHPNLVDLYELIADEKNWFFTMSYIEGVDFQTAMRRGRSVEGSTDKAETLELEDGPLEAPTGSGMDHAEAGRKSDPEETGEEYDAEGEASAPVIVPPLDEGYLRETFIELVTGVQFLHEFGMLHRDLKPGNVLVTPEGRAVLLDFGLVADLDSVAGAQPDDEDHSGITGTPRYLAPECAWDGPIDEAADWYSVGVMLYEVLTGRPPIEAETTLAALFQKNENPPTPIREYRTDVSDDLRNVCMDLLAIEPDERPLGPEILARLGADSSASGHFGLAPNERRRDETFVGREESLATLRESTERTLRENAPSLVNIRGESGVGKSALAKRFLRNWSDARPETAILSGRCYENESVPYKAFDGVIDELVPWLRPLPDGELSDLLGDGSRAIAQLFPVLRQLDAVDAPSVVTPSSDAQLRHEAFQALRRLLRQIAADRPLIIFIDDVQWGDEDSVRLLEHLLTGDDPPALTLITTWRDEDADTSPFLRSFLEMQRELPSSVRVEDVRLSELSADDARQLARQIVENVQDASTDSGSATIDIDRIADESNGNPLFVGELSRHSAELGAFDAAFTEFDVILEQRLESLPESTRRILEVIAVAGQPIAREMVRRIVGDETGDPSSFSKLRSNRLTRAKGTDVARLEPYHDRIRSALVDRLPEDRRRRLHRELAAAFESEEQPDPETIGFHLEEAGESDRAAECLIEASEDAAESLAFEHAAQLLRRALALRDWPSSRRSELKARLGGLNRSLGFGHRAADAYLEAAELADGLDVREYRIRAVEQLLRAGEVDAGTELLYGELEALNFSPANNRAVMLASIAYRRWKLQRRGFEFDIRPPDAVPRRDRLLLDVLTTATLMFGMIDLIRASYFHFHALPRALDAGHPSNLALLLCQQATQEKWSGRASRPERLLEAARSLLPECREDRGWVQSFIVVFSGMLEYFDGNWQPALEEFRRGKAILKAESPGSAWEIAANRFFESDCLHWLGAFDQMRDKLPGYLEEARQRNDTFHTVLFRTKMALTELCEDAPDRADDQLARARSEWTRKGYYFQDFWRFHVAVDTALYRGDLEAARRLLDERWGRLRRSFLAHSNVIRLHSWSIYGRVAAATVLERSGWRTWPARFRAWRARRNLRSIGTNCSEAFADLIDGQLALADGDRDRANERLRRAESRFDTANMAFHSRAVQFQRARLTPSAESEQRESSARRWMRERGIARPEAMVRLVVANPPKERLVVEYEE